MNLRPYQQEAVDTLLNHWADGGGNALVELATGTGKSLIAATLAQRMVEAGGRVGVVTHVRELVAQNYSALIRAWPQAPAGIYSAGLNKRDTRKAVTFASIQSIHRKAKALGPWDLVLIDECHLVPAKGEGMYRRFLEDMIADTPHMRVGGLTATPYRLGEGRLDRGEGRIFESTVYTYGIADGIRDGYLSPLISKAGASEVDVSRVGKSGGEFKQGELESAAMDIIEQAVAELVERGQDRRGWLIFCAGVKHAYQTRDVIRRYGITCETVTGETPSGERDRIIRDFKAGRIRALTNAQVLTTGFDAPHVDLVGMMRPTLSTSLYVQIVGRGTRLADGKKDCLVLDWAGNVRRHGPVDAVIPREPRRGAKSEEDEDGKVAEASVLAKTCPACENLVHIAVRDCPHCEYQWPPNLEPKHEAEADAQTPILSTERIPPKMLPVIDWTATRWTKEDKPPSMRVVITAGLASYPEWVAFEHGGYATQKAVQWWLEHGGRTPAPKSTDEAIARFQRGELTPPSAINIKPRGRFFDIVGRSFAAQEAAE